MKKFAGVVALLVAAGCSRHRYFAEGPGRRFDVSGEYRVEERPGRNNCRTTYPRVEDRIVVVEHTPNSTQLIFVVGKESVVAELRSDGRFKTATVARGEGYNASSTTIEGRFGKEGFAAVLTVTAADDVPPSMPRARASTEVNRTCQYVLRWDGKRL
jgi:hypothetical protein